MKKHLLYFLLILAVFITNQAKAEVFSIVYLNCNPTKLRAEDKAKNTLLWESSYNLSKTASLGKDLLILKETGRGIYGASKKDLQWEIEARYFFEGNRLMPGEVKIIFKNPQGQTTKTITKIYDLNKKKVICKVDGRPKFFEFPDDLIGTELIGQFLANYPFEQKKDLIFHLLTHEPRLYKITLKYRGEEKIRVGETDYNCYKLEMIPDLGALNIFGAIVPKTYFWFKKSAPHEFIRYEGLESGLGTPYIIEEIVPL